MLDFWGGEGGSADLIFMGAGIILKDLQERRTSKKPLTRVSKPAPGVHGKRDLERGWQKRLAKGWRRVGEGLAKGWHRVGEGLAKGWRVCLHPPILQFPMHPFRRRGL